ncbi:hypothetical protein L1987_22955 [Smallanthus sonchifolius]|uniref:Uncharacterized protein n=1 Tax=Smallanthus sonchifolius TaxID=185202 RepID=A0ACB9II21_9ASTR|nr:hypothetical protein L1987_22955 [Smallanthus sonchifolius]
MSFVSIDGAKLGVNIAKFDRFEEIQNESIRHAWRPHNVGAFSREKSEKVFRGSTTGASFKDILLQGGRKKDYKEHCKTIFLNPEPTIMEKECLGASLIGVSKSITYLCRLNCLFQQWGVDAVSLRYMGGLSFLISFKCRRLAEEFLDNQKNLWQENFSSLEVWDRNYLQQDRLAWLLIRGMPAMLWDNSHFDAIACSYGEVIAPSQAGVGDGNLTFDKVGILTRSFNRIQEKVLVKVQEQNYLIEVMEDSLPWSPDFLSASESEEKPSSPASCCQETGGRRVRRKSKSRSDMHGEKLACMGNSKSHDIYLFFGVKGKCGRAVK